MEPKCYEATQHHQRPSNTDIVSENDGESTRFTAPEISVHHISEPSRSSDVIDNDDRLLLEKSKRGKPVQVQHDVMSKADVLATHSPEHYDLDKRLRRERIECKGDEGRLFIPNNKLDEIICHDTVESYLSSMTHQIPSGEVQNITTYICGNREKLEEPPAGKRVFACLILANKADTVTLFHNDFICDKDLPLEKFDKDGSTFKLRRTGDENSDLKCFQDWTYGDFEAFDKHQRELTPPFFARDVNSHPLHYELSRGSCLPLTLYGDNIHSSSNSDVRRVEIHQAQHELQPKEKGNNLFALKTLKSKKVEEFNLEVKALKKILPHPNLVTLLATLHYREEYHLLFPWADGGNLLEFWQGHQTKPDIDMEWMLWYAEQCFGLAEGLSCIHKARMPTSELRGALPDVSEREATVDNNDDKDCGRHGDIKPQNILWFRQEHNGREHGVLKISDFGVTMFHSELTTKVLPERVRGVTQSYAAPEYELGPKVSRPYDIWSLGCIFLEFITWTLLGFQGVQEFREHRKKDKDPGSNFELDDFYRTSKKRLKIWKRHRKECALVKASVTKWIDHLLQQSAHSQYLSDFLKYINKHMIQVVASDRAKCDEVKDKLCSMMEHCKESPEYCTRDPHAG